MSFPLEPGRQPVRVVVLAAQRKGTLDPLAEAAGVSHKCLVPIAGQALIGHVVQALLAHPAVAKIVISVEEDAFGLVRNLLHFPDDAMARVHFVTARDNLADSVIAAVEDHAGPIIVTTADNVLLKSSSLDAMLRSLTANDAAVAMAPRDAVLAAHPLGQRRFYRFACGEYSNCNLYGLSSRSALSATETFRSGGQFAKKVWRIVSVFGLVNLIMLRFRLFSLEGAMKRISRRLGKRIAPVVLSEGDQAIDVDNARTFAIAEEILSRRGTVGQLPVQHASRSLGREVLAG